MVVLSRLINESVIIGNNIRVTILDVKDNQVRIGITAPDHTPSYWEQTIFTSDEDKQNKEPESLPLNTPQTANVS